MLKIICCVSKKDNERKKAAKSSKCKNIIRYLIIHGYLIKALTLHDGEIFRQGMGWYNAAQVGVSESTVSCFVAIS